jgi:hypothetical protein
VYWICGDVVSPAAYRFICSGDVFYSPQSDASALLGKEPCIAALLSRQPLPFNLKLCVPAQSSFGICSKLGDLLRIS